MNEATEPTASPTSAASPAGTAERLRLASQDRFARHRLIEGFSQDLVATLRIAVIGAGALGNELVKNLLLLGVGAVDVYDFDTVELSNLTRSVFLRESDVGMNKAEALVDRARELHPETGLRARTGPISRSLPLRALAEYDLVIAAVDNMEARLRLNDMALLSACNWMNVAIDARSAVVELFPFGAHADCACYACSLPVSVFERIAARYSCGGLQRAAWLERKVPTTAVTASAAAALACSEGLRFLHQLESEKSGSSPSLPAAPGTATRPLFGGFSAGQSQRVYLDTVTPSASRSHLRKASPQRGCPGCSLHQKAARISAVHGDAALLVKALQDNRAAGIDDPVMLSDALIMACECRQCGASPATNASLKALQYQRAADHDERILACPQCHSESVAVDIRDSLELDEFIRHFSARVPDCAWLQQGAHCFDLLASPQGMNTP